MATDRMHPSMPRTRHLRRRLRASLYASIGDVAFGMEDGAVSIAGLVFGVAASTNDSSIVLLAGATGAIAGAVSMMAGTYLDVESGRERALALVVTTRRRVLAHPRAAATRFRGRLRAAGFAGDEAETVAAAFARHPEALVDYLAAVDFGVSQHTGGSASVHALWMFVADLFAASVPVIPFALFDIGTARIVSLVVTAILLAALGVARGRIGHRGVRRTVVQTLAIAGTAAAAGVIIGRLVTR
jgi:vacuolar iron transporter family protein